MARKKTDNQELDTTEIAPEVAEALSQTQNTVAELQSAHSEERDTLNQLIGQIQMTGAIAKLTTVVGLTKLAHIKETRMYKALAGKKGVARDGSEIADVGTWEGFCLAIGTTRQKADEDILNLKSFGEEALEDLSKVGAGYRELRQLRKLPDDEKTALIEAAKSGDKDVFLDLAEEIISRQAASKALADENYSELQKDHQTQGEILAEVKEENTRLKLELKKLKPGTKMWHEAIAPLKEEIAHHQTFIDESLARHMDAVEAIDAWITAEVTSKPDYDPEADLVIPTQAITVLLQLDECINRSANLIAAARNHLQNEYGPEIAAARRQQLEETTEE